MGEFDNKVAFITGAAHGQGTARRQRRLRGLRRRRAGILQPPEIMRRMRRRGSRR